ncbi:inhibitor of apoptosis-promoting Bax1-domain-containing protein [Yarrowia lipolytica]|nr:inhibitor of apoptosis-promoting Bax1-domain-containing protein [Yarrowia lipolytica]RDW52610.1 inhibitor of apoptosis-promoting Bax1-domain-containing protein [Yarrowia lipolytica]
MSAPPAYEPLLNPNDQSNLNTASSAAVRDAEDNLPADFKYDTPVVQCDIDVRNNFIKQVYTIVTAQIATTAIFGAIIVFNPPITMWILEHMWVYYVTIFGSLGCLIACIWKQNSYPLNMTLLGVFTLCQGLAIGTVCSLMDSKVFLQAVAITLVLFFGLTLFAFQTKYDLTSMAGILSACLWGLIGVGLVGMFVPFSSAVELIYSSIGALVFSGYILVDTQMIIRKLHPDQVIPAAINIYLDILNLFLYILRILNEINRDN